MCYHTENNASRMTKEVHIQRVQEETVLQVVRAGAYDRYQQALLDSFWFRFVTRKVPMLKDNLTEWVKEQISACAHALPQDLACRN